jgi:hypothetical protein
MLVAVLGIRRSSSETICKEIAASKNRLWQKEGGGGLGIDVIDLEKGRERKKRKKTIEE